jgi:hypothetical protein
MPTQARKLADSCHFGIEHLAFSIGYSADRAAWLGSSEEVCWPLEVAVWKSSTSKPSERQALRQP